jgi:hypothetical protein
MADSKFAVEASHIMMFARSVGDANPIYYDEEYAKGTEPGTIIAPPTFAQSSAQFQEGYPLRPKIGKPWFGSGATPSGTLMPPEKKEAKSEGEKKAESGDKKAGGGEKKTSGAAAGGLHAEQHFTYHRQLKPGDVLTATTSPGKTWEKQGKRAGKLVFSETITEYRDADGQLVVTARGVGVRTERVIEQS